MSLFKVASSDTLLAVAIGTGRVEINPPYMQDVNGDLALDVSGSPQFMNGVVFEEDGEHDWALDPHGKRQLFLGSRAQLLGTKTPLSTTTYPCLWVVFTAYDFNLNNIFIAGPTVKFGNRYAEGNRLVPGASITIPSIDDLSKVFVHGYERDGGYFEFGQSESQYLGDADYSGLQDTDYTLLGGN